MPFRKSKTFLFALLMITSFGHAESESILSQDRLDIFKYNQEQNLEDSAKLRKDWINAITYKYAFDYAEGDVDSKKSIISINQPIFKSGGIYAAINYANHLESYGNIDIELQKKALITQAYTLLFQIHRASYSIEKQKLLLHNAQIDIERKKEQVLNGFIDTSFLDEAILEANIRKNALIELKYNKLDLINSFNNIASGEYKKFELPKLTLLDKEAFLTHNLQILKSQSDIKYKDSYYYMSIAKYLPSVNVTYDYTKYHDIKNSSTIEKGDDNEQYGINVTIPLDTRVYNDIQSSKIDYLIAKTNLENVKLEQANFFKTTLQKISMLEDKIKIAKEDYKLYNSLLEIITQEKEAELKTQSDVDTLQNSQKVKSIERNIHEMDKQIELLKLYEKVSS